VTLPTGRWAPVADAGSRWRRRLEPWADVAVALAVLTLSLFPVIRAEECDCEHVPTWLYALVVAESLPLMLRRRYPFAVVMVVGPLGMVYGLANVVDPPVHYAALVAIYSAAAHASPLKARLTGVIAALSLGVVLIADDSADLEDIVVNYLIFATAWLLGDSARTRRERNAELEARAEQAERTRAAEADRAVVAERNRIAREMHDVVAHHVSMMVVQAEAGPVVVERDPQRAVAAFDAISATGKQALVEMRRLLGVLRESETGSERAPQPGLHELDALADRVRSAGLDVRVGRSGRPRELPPALDVSAFRLLQEALTNVVRHAGPARVDVRVDYRDDSLVIAVEDDGVGIAVEDDGVGSPLHQDLSGGHGLVAMRERVGLLGGTLTAGPRAGGGWRVEAVLPYDRVSAS
jgi:signal transduction histidine kinase